MSRYSHIVVGGGALGVAAAYWLAKSGARDVLVLEQFELGNDRGASEDHSRIIRHSYHSADYTALTPAAYETWRELEDETGLQLVVRTGGLDLATLGTPGIAELDNYRGSLRAAGIPWQDLTASELRSRFPQWRIDDDVVAMYQEDTGLLDVRRATAAHVARARAMGVSFRPHTAVTALRSSHDHVLGLELCLAGAHGHVAGRGLKRRHRGVRTERDAHLASACDVRGARATHVEQARVLLVHGDDLVVDPPLREARAHLGGIQVLPRDPGGLKRAAVVVQLVDPRRPEGREVEADRKSVV